ncbi:hypothetical protein B9Z47_05365 [Limnohabitans sp. 2KL-1]|uniref:recombinase family protein n=1 Tax=Limnohabitans sp. 2KL-1 TaxID=1100699 RepID=UPI000D3BE6C0|nr:recombinase family protein [Limnohabitans sp. 2KL-1]PUE48944.1 hypothetical protein B9Z47_05365 [Limnohabitans sp. 2KL-1]
MNFVNLSVAIYARYSCQKQNDTSLEDQIRRCRELAQHKFGIQGEVPFYTDAALTASDEDTSKREGYTQMMADWHAGKFDVLLVDEFSRLSRDGVEQAKLVRTLERDKRRRLLTCDGTDTNNTDWQLPLALKGMLAQQESRNLRFRVARGMEGQLKRGFMIAAPAYGYQTRREYDAVGNSIGTHWVVKQQEADIVKQVFEMRSRGQSMHQIASWLNTSGIACRRKARNPDGGYWRPSAVKNMLQNTIYKGMFFFRGSVAFRKKMRDMNAKVESVAYVREQLRLVSDELWDICNQNKVSRSGYGGGKHAFSSIFTCACCTRPMNVTAKQRSRSIYCPDCMIAKGTDNQRHRETTTVGVDGVSVMLKLALQQFMTPEFIVAFRNALKLRLTGGAQEEVRQCEERMRKLRQTMERMSRMLGNLDTDDPLLEAQYQESRLRLQETQARHEQLQSGLQQVNAHAIEAQLKAHPEILIDKLFDGSFPPERLRALLSRLFPVAVYEGKNGTHTAYFKLRFAMGAVFSAATNDVGTQVDQQYEARFELSYINATKTGPNWSAEMMGLPVLVAPNA